MLSSQLSKLKEIINKEEVERVEQYVDSFNLNTKITVSKFATSTEISLDSSSKVLSLLSDMGILTSNFAVRCPQCGLLIKMMENFTDIDTEILCYNCEQETEISSDNIEVVYTVEKIPFPLGQQSKKIMQSILAVLKEDSLTAYLEKNHYNLNEIYYSPSEDELSDLKEQYEKVFSSQTTKDKGDTLEQLVLNLFNLCKQFEATNGLKPRPNQIDCYVRNKICSPGVPGIGEIKCFCIECKNEEEKPSITYLNKIHSILKITGNNFGIIVSKRDVPRTYATLANKIYLSENIIIIALDKNDLEDIIINKKNLLSMIEMKVNEVKLDATRELRDIGLYTEL